MANRLTIGYIQNGVLTPNTTYAELFHHDRKQLAAIAKRIFENANRRMENIRARNLTGYSQPTIEIMRSVGKRFSARGKTNGELVTAIFQADNFLKQNDSTVKAAKANRKRVAERLPNLTENERRLWLRANDRMFQKYPRFFEYLNRNAYASEQYRQYAQEIFQSARGSIVGGLGGDLFASDKRVIIATAAEREKAFFDAIDKIEKYVKAEHDRLYPPVRVRGVKSSPKFSAKDWHALNGTIEVEKI